MIDPWEAMRGGRPRMWATGHAGHGPQRGRRLTPVRERLGLAGRGRLERISRSAGPVAPRKQVVVRMVSTGSRTAPSSRTGHSGAQG